MYSYTEIDRKAVINKTSCYPRVSS